MWIQEAKAAISVRRAADELDLRAGRLRSYGPCPGCGAETRGSGDARGPIGETKDGRGWSCHRCEARGDVVDLVSWRLQGASYPDAQDKGEVRGWFARRGLCEYGRDGPELDDLGGREEGPPASLADAIGAAIRRHREDDRQPPEARQRGGGPQFGWGEGRAEELAAALWEDPLAEPVRRYLLEDRLLPEEVLREWGIGALVVASEVEVCDADGCGAPMTTRPSGPVCTGDPGHGAPPTREERRAVELWAVVPLRRSDERVVNLRFRRLPGECPACAGAGCSRCSDTGEVGVRGNDRYRVCPGRPLPLFGSHTLSADLGGRVIVVGGEFDVLATVAYGWDASVVSSSSGEGTWKDAWIDEIEPYAEFLIALDNDDGGDEGAAKLAGLLGRDRCLRVRLPANDVNDCLVEGVEADRVARAFDRAESMAPIKLADVSTLGEESEARLADPERFFGVSTGSDAVDRILGGVRSGVFLITGETGSGKSTFATWLVRQLAVLHGDGGVIASLENGYLHAYHQLLAMTMGESLKRSDRGQRDAAREELGALPISVVKHHGEVAWDDLLPAMKSWVRRRGVSRILLDHVEFLLDGSARDERREIDRVSKGLAGFVRDYEVTVFLIAHPSKISPDWKGRKRRVTMHDVKGSSALKQLAWDAAVVERLDPTKERRYPASEVHFDKIRKPNGVAGTSAVLAFDPFSQTYADSWAETPAGLYGRTPVQPG